MARSTFESSCTYSMSVVLEAGVLLPTFSPNCRLQLITWEVAQFCNSFCEFVVQCHSQAHTVGIVYAIGKT